MAAGRVRHRHRLRPQAAEPQGRADRGRRRQADGRAAAALLASDRAGRRCHRHAAPGARARRGPDPVPRQGRPARPGALALRPPRRLALLRPRGGRRHPLLLPRLDVRRAGPLRRPALRARERRAHPRPRAPALVPGRGALRPGLGLPRPGREEAGAAALRLPGGARRGRDARGRRQQHRRRRAADRSLQLAAALRKRGRPLPRAGAARQLQRHPVRGADGPDARGELREHRDRRDDHLDPPPRGRPRVPPRGRAGAADPARGAEPARGDMAGSSRSAGCCRSTTTASASTPWAG